MLFILQVSHFLAYLAEVVALIRGPEEEMNEVQIQIKVKFMRSPGAGLEHSAAFFA